MGRALSSHSCTLAAFATFFAVQRCRALDPTPATWSSKQFGPDGPWPAVEIKLDYGDTVALYPGGHWQSALIPTTYCANQQNECPAGPAGLLDTSKLVDDGPTIHVEGSGTFMRGVPMEGHGISKLITLDLQQRTFSRIPDVTVSLLDPYTRTAYPDGRQIPLSVGCLSLGAEDVNQTFSQYNGTFIPSYLYEQQKSDSNSFGMHLGSVNLKAKVPGSLYFGGYDQNRVLGKVITLHDFFHQSVRLNDIKIAHYGSSSPWDFGAAKEGLLAGNSQSSSGRDVVIDGCSPYLTLPKSTCDAIANHLPVTYNSDLGLYLWDVENHKFSEIVSSASALEFEFLGSENTETVSIAVPFAHLNLTLDSPLVTQPQQYFPCFTGSETYTLGRAFLQDAFLGANWKTRTWWLAQAPGPNISRGRMQSILADDTSITASKNDWKASWAETWNMSSIGINETDSLVEPNELNTGAQAGIGVGAAIVGILLIVGFIFCLCRWRKARHKEASGAASSQPDGGAAAYSEVDHVPTPLAGSYGSPTISQHTQLAAHDTQYKGDSRIYAAEHVPAELPSSTSTVARKQL